MYRFTPEYISGNINRYIIRSLWQYFTCCAEDKSTCSCWDGWEVSGWKVSGWVWVDWARLELEWREQGKHGLGMETYWIALVGGRAWSWGVPGMMLDMWIKWWGNKVRLGCSRPEQGWREQGKVPGIMSDCVKIIWVHIWILSQACGN